MRWGGSRKHARTPETGKRGRVHKRSRESQTGPARPMEYYINLTVTDADGYVDQAKTYFVVENGVANVEWATENPRWVDDAMVYGVVPHFGLKLQRHPEARLS